MGEYNLPNDPSCSFRQNTHHPLPHDFSQHAQSPAVQPQPWNEAGGAPSNSSINRPPPPRKAKRHRKRHVPVGPAGVWFQNFQQSSSADGRTVAANSGNDKQQGGNNSNCNDDDDDEDEEEDQQDAWQNLRRSIQRRHHHHSSSVISSFSSPAWIAMQCDCQWITPSLSHQQYKTVQERYQLIRPHVPKHFTMIHELLVGDNNTVSSAEDGKSSSSLWFCKHLMVLVTNIHGGATDHGWTVALTDETGATLTAWIQPASVRRQLQRSSSSSNNDKDAQSSSTSSLSGSWFRTGCVWWLQNTTLLLSAETAGLSPSENNTDETSTLSFLLLVSEENVYRVWTPSDGASLSDEAYLQWMERRSQLDVAGGNHAHESRRPIDQNGPLGRRDNLRGEPRLEEPGFPSPQQTLQSLSQTQLHENFRQHSQPERIQRTRHGHKRSPLSRPLEATARMQQQTPPPRASQQSDIYLSSRRDQLFTDNAHTRTHSQAPPSHSLPGNHAHSLGVASASFVTQPPGQPQTRIQSMASSGANQTFSNTETAAGSSSTQETTTVSGNSLPSLPTVESSQRSGINRGLDQSPFAAFAYTGLSQDDGFGAPLPSASKHQRETSPLRRDSCSALQRPQSTPSDVVKNLSSYQGNSSKETSSQTPVATLPRSQTTPKSKQVAHASKSSTTSNKKSRNSSAKKRKRQTFKLWSGGFCLDLSDDEDESNDYTRITIVKPVKLAMDEDDEEPKKKKSLFRHGALLNLANLLSSDEEDNGARILKKSLI